VFVTVLAWILIVLCMLAFASAILQMIAVGGLSAPRGAAEPQIAEGVGGFFRGIAVANVAITAFFAYAAYALLQRRNWARRTFVVVFAVGLAANLLSIVAFGLGAWFAGSLFSSLAQEQGGEIGSVFTALFVFGAVFAVAMSLLHGWLLKRLRSAAVKSEFGAAT
jgi:hypothetical protein